MDHGLGDGYVCMVAVMKPAEGKWLVGLGYSSGNNYLDGTVQRLSVTVMDGSVLLIRQQGLMCTVLFTAISLNSLSCGIKGNDRHVNRYIVNIPVKNMKKD